MERGGVTYSVKKDNQYHKNNDSILHPKTGKEAKRRRQEKGRYDAYKRTNSNNKQTIPA